MPLAEVPINCCPGCRDECECKSDPWHRVLLPVLCCTATRLLLLQNMSDPRHSVSLPVLCIYLLEWFGSRRFAAGSISGNNTKLHPQWRVQSLFWPSACFWGDANLYSSTTLCIRLNSSKIHSSNNNVAVCAASFILKHSLQLRVQRTYQHPQACFQYPISFEYFTCCTLSTCALLPQHWNLQDQRIQLRDLRGLNNLSLTPLFVVLNKQDPKLNEVAK